MIEVASLSVVFIGVRVVEDGHGERVHDVVGVDDGEDRDGNCEALWCASLS